jgi:hypothetical protein
MNLTQGSANSRKVKSRGGRLFLSGTPLYPLPYPTASLYSTLIAIGSARHLS